ncbi:MAG: RagB/SusD family nutrient uptake outer membrane protein [Porphyromonas sp.]|nr:RagB/SusD family nutrient uptake outer membrane protein [Porphyromonas sp.]
MIQYKKTLIVAGVGALLLGSSCTSGYEDYNRDPYGATKEQMSRDGYSFRSAMQNLQAAIIPIQPNTSQFTECLLGGTYGGYLSDSNAGFNGKNFAQYNPEENWSKVLFVDQISSVMINYNEVKSATQDPVPLAIALVCKVMGMHRIVDAYGPIPYTHVGADKKIVAPYDSQEQAYDRMFAELNEAIAVLTEHKNSVISPDADPVYRGSVLKWLRLANSLKLRLAMRISKVAPEKAKTHVEAAVNHPDGVMTTLDGLAAFTPATTNPFYVVMYQWNNGDSRVSADITSYMNGYSDPRREAMFTPSTFPAVDNGYIGLRNGVQIPGNGTEKQYANYKLETSTPVVWMNPAEVAFLRAEAKLYGWNVGGQSAKELYEAGIKLSFEQWGVNGADSYISNAAAEPQAHRDPVNPSFSNTGSVSSVKIAWDETGSQEINLEQIITQKWIANFPLGLEAWSEYRRTGYPRLMPSPVNNSTVVGARGARRLAYPQTERTDNAQNYTVAVTTMLQGADNMATDVWWAKKN